MEKEEEKKRGEEENFRIFQDKRKQRKIGFFGTIENKEPIILKTFKGTTICYTDRRGRTGMKSVKPPKSPALSTKCKGTTYLDLQKATRRKLKMRLKILITSLPIISPSLKNHEGKTKT